MGAPRHKPHDALEYIQLLGWFRGAGSILEIGSRFGYPLVDFAHCMNEKGRVVSVDLPDAEGWNPPLDTESSLRANVQSLVNEGYDAHLFIGDSKSPEIVSKVRQLGPYDVVFIDGDHSYEGVKADWQNYGDLGRYVIFHDIREPRPPEWMGMGVWKLWEEIEDEFPGRTETFLAQGSKMGIGRLDRT